MDKSGQYGEGAIEPGLDQDGAGAEGNLGYKGLWKMMQRVEDIMAGLRETLCDTCREEGRGQEREQCEERSVRAPSNDREQRGPQQNKES